MQVVALHLRQRADPFLFERSESDPQFSRVISVTTVL
jgi:hypothetical protein